MSNYTYQNATPETATDAQIARTIKNLHTALPAIVQSFNPEKQTVTLFVAVKQILVDNKTVQIPPLVDVPVSYPRGGGFAVTFPLQSGDEGIAVFSERCIDGWHSSGKATEPLDYRLHDLSDAMFIPGVCSLPKTIKDFFTGGLSMQTLDGGTHIRVTNGTIYIKGNIEHEGNTQQKGNITQKGSFSQTGGETVSSGTITSTADVIASNVSLKNHVHGGVIPGGSNTTGPQ